MTGRPPIPFDPELADQICEGIGTTDLGLEEILAELTKYRKTLNKKTPALRTVYRWLVENEDFRQQSAHARTLQAQLLHDRAQKYAREPMLGTVTRVEKGPDGKKTITTESDNVERSKLLVQTTLRRAGQLDPKKYGESTTIRGDRDNPIPITLDSSELIAKIMGAALTNPPESVQK